MKKLILFFGVCVSIVLSFSNTKDEYTSPDGWKVKKYKDGFSVIGYSGRDIVSLPAFINSKKIYAIESLKGNISNAISVDLSNCIHLESIRDEAFKNCGLLKEVKLPNGIVSIGKRAFMMCKSLQSINMPNSITEIGEETFTGCKLLENVTVPSNIKHIRKGLFYGCGALKSIKIPNGVISIGKEAFRYCISLRLIEIPNSVTEIGEGTFSICSSLESIKIPNSVTNIGKEAFSDSGLKILSLPGKFNTDKEKAKLSISKNTEVVVTP